MRRDARMLAALLGRSMGLGEAWEVSGTWSGEVEGGVPTSPAPGWPGGAATRSPARSAASPVACATPAGAPGATPASGSPGPTPAAPCRGRTAPSTARGPRPCPGGCGRTRTSRPSSGTGRSRPACGAGPPGRRTGRPSGTTTGPGTCSGARSRRPGGSADHPGAGRVGHRRDQPLEGPHLHTRHARPRRQEVRTARRAEATGHRAPHVRPDLRPSGATGRRSPRPPATCRAPSPPASRRRCLRRRRPQAAST